MQKIFNCIFSITNEEEHKIVRLLGFKFKFKQNVLPEKILNSINNINEQLLISNNSTFLLENINNQLIAVNNNILELNNISKLGNINNQLIAINNNIMALKSEIEANKTDVEHLSWAIRDKFYGIVNGVKFSPCETLVSEAHADTVNFIKDNMDLNKLLLKHDRLSNLQYSTTLKSLNGLILEFGVFSGETINLIANNYPHNTVYGFDSFEGLPEDWNGWSLEKSFFKRDNLPDVKDNVTLVKGWFEETLPKFLEEHNEVVSFLHIDSDIYSSAKYVLTTLKDRIKPGTIIVFDEYFNFPNWRNHEYKAFMEFIGQTGYQFEYLSIGHDQVTVKIF